MASTYTDERPGERIAAPDTFVTKSDANLWLSTVATDRSRGRLGDHQLSQRPFEDWANEWLSGLHVKPKTLVNYESSLRNHVLPVFVGKPVGTITYRDAKHFVSGLAAKKLVPGTISEAGKILRMVLQGSATGRCHHPKPCRRPPSPSWPTPRDGVPHLGPGLRAGS